MYELVPVLESFWLDQLLRYLAGDTAGRPSSPVLLRDPLPSTAPAGHPALCPWRSTRAPADDGARPPAEIPLDGDVPPVT